MADRVKIGTERQNPHPSKGGLGGAPGNRLFVVISPSGKGPIQAVSKQLGHDGKPKWLWETGSYWIHRPDGWFVIRQ